MNIHIQIKAIFELKEGTTIEPSRTIEVSLDCSTCKKRYRTVVIKEQKDESFCTPTLHKFDAVITKIYVNNTVEKKFLRKKYFTEIVYHIDYFYKEFIDTRGKYSENHSRPIADFARIYFNITCPNCHHIQRESTQNNLGLPFKALCEKCSSVLYKQEQELPLFEKNIQAICCTT